MLLQWTVTENGRCGWDSVKQLIWVKCWRLGSGQGTRVLLVSLWEWASLVPKMPPCETAYRGQENRSVWGSQDPESKGKEGYQGWGRTLCGWEKRKVTDGDSSGEARAARHCCGSAVSSHWSPSPHYPEGLHSPQTVVYKYRKKYRKK